MYVSISASCHVTLHVLGLFAPTSIVSRRRDFTELPHTLDHHHLFCKTTGGSRHGRCWRDLTQTKGGTSIILAPTMQAPSLDTVPSLILPTNLQGEYYVPYFPQVNTLTQVDQPTVTQ